MIVHRQLTPAGKKRAILLFRQRGGFFVERAKKVTVFLKPVLRFAIFFSTYADRYKP